MFVNLYLDALRAWASAPAKAPKAWVPLFAARSTPRIAPIQFALAGMNAHINRDLPVAIVATWQELRLKLRDPSPEHDDYVKVNALLAQTEKKVKHWFDTGFVGIVDASLGSADDRIAMWNVERARDAAWVQGEALWALRGVGLPRAPLPRHARPAGRLRRPRFARATTRGGRLLDSAERGGVAQLVRAAES